MSVKTFLIEGEKADHLFWVESVPMADGKLDDPVFYQVDFGDSTKFMYSGPDDSHKEVLADTVQRLVNQNRFPETLLDSPIKAW